jgi:hypothetical protein
MCGGVHTELHATWDTGMIHAMLKAKYGSITAIKAWADTLTTEIRSGSYQAAAAGWISCSSTKRLISGSDSQSEGPEVVMSLATAVLECPLVWAQESNAYGCVCLYVHHTYVSRNH